MLLTRAALTGKPARSCGSIIDVAFLLAFSGAVQAAFLPSGSCTWALTPSWLPSASYWPLRYATAGTRFKSLAPGVVRSEFHSRQGIDRTMVHQMEPL